jgi:hypothetical protein
VAVTNSIKVGPLVLLAINVCNHGEHHEMPCICLIVILLQVILTSFYFLEYIILLRKYQRCAVEVTVFLKFAVNEDSLHDHYIPNQEFK